MKIMKYISLGLVLSAACFLFGNTGTEFQFSGVEDVLVFLKNAEVVSIQPDENAGRTEPWMVILNDDKMQRKAIFKHIDRTRPFPLADSFKYELSAYKLHRMLGLNFIPPTVARTIDGRPGALQLFIEDCMPLEEARQDESVNLDLELIRSRMQDIDVFDALTYCGCKQTGDVLYQLYSGHICRVDYSEAFAPIRNLPPDCRIQGCSQDFLEQLRSVDGEAVRRELDRYLNKEEINALLLRRQLIIEQLTAADANGCDLDD